MSTEIVPHTSSNGAALAMHDWRGFSALAETLAKSNIIPAHLRNKPGDVLVILLTGQELGIGPMTALRSVHVLDGKPMMSADLMAAVALRSPDCLQFQCVESTEKKCVYHAKRRGDEKATETVFTFADAQAARLVGRDNWVKYPKAMLRARCCAAAARERFPDVLAGVYESDIEEEIDVVIAKTAEASEAKRDRTLDDMVPPEDRAATAGPAVAPSADDSMREAFTKSAEDFLSRIAAVDSKPHWTAFAKNHGKTLGDLAAQMEAHGMAELAARVKAAVAEKRAAFVEPAIPCSVDGACKAAKHDEACPSWLPSKA